MNRASDLVMQPGRNPAPAEIVMEVTAGWHEHYRPGPAWLPIRATLRNQSSRVVQGALQVPEAGTLYRTLVDLLAGATRHVTVYIPATDVAGKVDVAFTDGARTLAATTIFLSAFENATVTVGVLTTDPASTSWLNRVQLPRGTLDINRLDPTTLDAVPAMLASFDTIILTNVVGSHLDTDQTNALERYVRNGGSLLLIGGPAGEQSLQPLPPTLLPGELAGSTTIPDLTGLATLASSVTRWPPAAPVAVTRLRSAQGIVLAEEQGIPLVVRSILGNGQIEFVAFDPAVDPIPGWASAGEFLGQVLSGAAPLAMRRLSRPDEAAPGSFLEPMPDLSYLSDELRTVPHAFLPGAVLLASAVALYCLILLPLTMLLLRRRNRSRFIWGAVPLLAILSLVGIVTTMSHFKERTIVLNTVGMVEMDGPNTVYPARLYVGMYVPWQGAYMLRAPSGQTVTAGLAQPLTAESHGTVVEGATTQVAFPAAAAGSWHQVALHTVVSVPGSIQTRLILDRRGDITGSVTNATPLPLLHPALIAGRATVRLPDIASGARVAVRIRPVNDPSRHDYPDLLSRIYGQAPLHLRGSPLATENTLDDRIRNVVATLPETRLLPVLGELALVAWTDQPLAPLSTGDGNPQRRDLSLLVRPLRVTVPHGAFTLRTGTIGAALVDARPAPPGYAGSNGESTLQPIYIGAGGSASFAFILPRISGGSSRLHFSRLTLWAYGGGQVETYTNYTAMPPGVVSIFDWRANRWEKLAFSQGRSQLSRPDRFVSGTGAVLVRVAPPHDSIDITIADTHEDLQLSGAGSAE